MIQPTITTIFAHSVHFANISSANTKSSKQTQHQHITKLHPLLLIRNKTAPNFFTLQLKLHPGPLVHQQITDPKNESFPTQISNQTAQCQC